MKKYTKPTIYNEEMVAHWLIQHIEIMAEYNVLNRYSRQIEIACKLLANYNWKIILKSEKTRNP